MHPHLCNSYQWAPETKMEGTKMSSTDQITELLATFEIEYAVSVNTCNHHWMFYLLVAFLSSTVNCCLYRSRTQVNTHSQRWVEVRCKHELKIALLLLEGRTCAKISIISLINIVCIVGGNRMKYFSSTFHLSSDDRKIGDIIFVLWNANFDRHVCFSVKDKELCELFEVTVTR